MLQRWWCHCSLVNQTQLNTLKPYRFMVSDTSATHVQYMGFQTVCIHHGARTASEAPTCNQSSAYLCQVNSANFQLRKNWILGLIFRGLCQEESSGVFLSMRRNAFSSPMKDYSKSLSHNTHPSALLSRRAIAEDNRQMEGWKKRNVKGCQADG